MIGLNFLQNVLTSFSKTAGKEQHGNPPILMCAFPRLNLEKQQESLRDQLSPDYKNLDMFQKFCYLFRHHLQDGSAISKQKENIPSVHTILA